MNLFFLDIDPKKCAEYHCDKHVVKMILEITQMLYTAHHLLNSKNLPVDHYKKISTHNHPTAIWIRSSNENYSYAGEIAMELSKEYTFRYNKVHSCDKHLLFLINNIPENIPITGITVPPMCMPEDSKLPINGIESVIKSYRRYYIIHKRYFAKWTYRPIPKWFKVINIYLINNI